MQDSRIMTDREHLENTVKIPSLMDFKFQIHDFHMHLDDKGEALNNYLAKFKIQSICLMPSWKIKSVTDFQSKLPNDFTINFIEKVEKGITNLHKTDWSGKIYIFAPIVMAATFSSLNESYLSTLTNLKRIRIAGVKFHPLQQFPITREFLDPIMKIIKREHLAVYIHTDWIPSTEFGKVKGLMPETFNKIVGWYPDVNFIMGHSGNNDSYLSIWKVVKKYPNVIAETSMAPAPQELEKIIKHCGVRRVVFGSNFPFSSPQVEILKILRLYKISDEEKQQIFYHNAIEFLRDLPHN